MKNHVKDLMEKEDKVSKAMDGDLKQIIQNNFFQIAAKFPANSFQWVFWNHQAQSASSLASSYDQMVLVLQLSSQHTLRDYTHYVPATIGFSHQVDKMLMDTCN